MYAGEKHIFFSQLFRSFCEITSNNWNIALPNLDMTLILGGPPDIINRFISYIEPKLKIEFLEEIKKKEDINEEDYLIISSPPSNLPLITNETSIERLQTPSLEDFKSRYFEKELPLVITGAITHWKALNEWINLKFFDQFGNRIVPIEIGNHHEQGWKEQTITMHQFCREYLIPSNRSSKTGEKCPKVGYLAQHTLFDQLPDLKNYFEVPSYASIGTLTNINAWFGTSGTVTPLHYDTYDNLLTQIFGYKYVRLYAQSESKFLYRVSSSDKSGKTMAQGNISLVDLENVDHEKFSIVKRIKIF